MENWRECKLEDIIEFNPKETIQKGSIAKKIEMSQLIPFCRDVIGYTKEIFYSGTKFRNGDTIMARITPCLENGKTAKISLLNDNEIGFGSTEYIILRAKKEISDADYIYYLATSSFVRECAIKSMVGSSGRQRVQLDVVKNLEISCPSYTEQQKIAKLLRLLDDEIELKRQINANLLLLFLLLFVCCFFFWCSYFFSR
ncbi:restriction endonuclease subunit S [Treponema vincentii]|uniref:restriction endonuclease subunit S n=1 Tax=Treponema vincentii TaxID=69710 RepID=UPI003D8C9053